MILQKMKKTIKIIKIMTKNCKYFTFIQSIKFIKVQIKLNLESVVLIRKSYVDSILFITDYNTNFNSLKGIIRKNYY